ncbi:SAV_6107 family HEPN domain-containing protein [Amycolatopsis tolypomycina]|uniref:SAV_6107 family HEPN domain-containing protein n=1 Tax=Amycolatopsis tolypomycina TaxID=208445 RepID=UPI0033BBF943
MSVKVVSPTDPGQPELPMSLRPQPAQPPAAPRGRTRQCLAAPAPDPRQPQLPIPLCPAAATRPSSAPAQPLSVPEQLRPASAALPLRSAASGGEPGQLELPSPGQPGTPAEPWSTAAGAAGDPAPAAGAGQAELPGPTVADQPRSAAASAPPAADAGQAERPVREVAEQPRSAAADAGRSELPAVGGAAQAEPVADAAGSGAPAASAAEVSVGAEAGRAELPVREAAEQPRSVPANAGRVELPAVGDAAQAEPVAAEVEPRVPVAPGAGSGSPELPLSLRPPTAVESDQSALPMSLRPPASPAAAGLLAQARRGLAEAVQESRPAERFIGAYLAALRGAAAVLAARGRPHRGRARPASTWDLLDSVAPELREWSAFFASNSATRAAAQAGITGKVTAESAAGLVGAATPFLELVRRLVHGLPITGEAHVA